MANALNASPPRGNVTLRSTIEAGFWRVSVEDQGPGVSAELRERIFERFFRVPSSTAADDNGSGLGLAIRSATARIDLQ